MADPAECVCVCVCACVVWCGVVCVCVCVCVCVRARVYLFAEDKYDDVSAGKYSSLMTTLSKKKNQPNLISE